MFLASCNREVGRGYLPPSRKTETLVLDRDPDYRYLALWVHKMTEAERGREIGVGYDRESQTIIAVPFHYLHLDIIN
jgi:hypothetical protein